MCDEAGPPTAEDDAWYQHHVVSKGYPKLRREPKQMDGQRSLLEALAEKVNDMGGAATVWPVVRMTDEGPERLDG